MAKQTSYPNTDTTKTHDLERNAKCHQQHKLSTVRPSVSKVICFGWHSCLAARPNRNGHKGHASLQGSHLAHLAPSWSISHLYNNNSDTNRNCNTFINKRKKIYTSREYIKMVNQQMTHIDSLVIHQQSPYRRNATVYLYGWSHFNVQLVNDIVLLQHQQRLAINALGEHTK